MKSVVIAGSAAALFVLAVSGAAAQSLGDVAAQEAERRKNIKSSGKVYTNGSVRSDDAGSAAPAPAPPGTPSTTAPAPATTTPAPGASGQPGARPVADEVKNEAYWKKRVTAARDGLSRAQTFAEALQTRINVLSADFVNRDDPAQRNIVGGDRQKALAELDRVKQEIQQYQKALTDIQDEARRANVPSGWVR